MFRADLHCHSTHSDGQCSPKDLVLLAKKRGLTGLCITDHDVLSAYNEASDFAFEQGLELLSGIELSCEYKAQGSKSGFNESVHILGYGFNAEDVGLKKVCHNAQKARKERNYAIADKLKQKGLPIDIDKLYEENRAVSIGRPHLAQAMMNRGYVASFKEAFVQFLGDGKSCFVSLERLSVEEGIKALHQACGFAILAHPHLIKSKALQKQLLQLNFDGIEAHYAKMPKDKNAYFEALAEEKGWIVSAGSDFHGEGISHANLGDSFVGKEVFDTLKKGRL